MQQIGNEAQLPRRYQPPPIPANFSGEYSELADLKYAIDQAAIVTTSDIRGTITYVNEMALKIYGYSRSEVIGKNHRILNSGVHSKEFFKDLWDTVLAGEVWHGEICNRSKDGSLHWLDTTIIPFVDDAKKPHHFMSIRKDITVRKRMEEELKHEQRKRFTIERLSAIGEMAANIAHEIKSPLSGIQMQAQLLLRYGAKGTLTPEVAMQGAKRIEAVAQRMNKIIEGLLSLSRDAASDPFERTSTKKLIDDTLDFCIGNLEKRGIKILRSEQELEFFIDCRPIQISQVLLNLINNARDAIEALEEKWIRIEVSSAFGAVQISVADSGTGLTPKLRARIMEPFFTTKREGKGTGLGLSISRKILEDHGGQLLLSDSKNTCFLVKFPKAESGCSSS
ncbi:MAG: two-component system sensor histidine kinase NtrB [Bdellovibrionota bacterium]